MRVNKIYKPKSFKFKDNFNIDYTPYYTINNGVYKFIELKTKINFMSSFGITCQCERRYKNNKLIYCYNNIEITKRQRDFLHKRAQALATTYNIQATTGLIHYDCGCKKKRQE